MIVSTLKENGPCLSFKLTQILVDKHGLSPEAARKRVSRGGKGVKKLAHLPFQRRARFMYLQDDYASSIYWERLFEAIGNSGGAYARALNAVIGREVITLKQFKIACGSPVAQKKHIPASSVLDRLISADILVKKTIPGVGDCVITKQDSECFRNINYQEIFLAKTKGRLGAESVLIDCVREWLKRLAFASFNSVKTRSDSDVLPMVGTFAWDITAPSYMSGLVGWEKDTVKPGFVVCDVLLNREVSIETIEPFLYKVSTTKALRNVGSVMFMFVSNGYAPDAFRTLREAGVIPATIQSLFGKEAAENFSTLMDAFTNAVNGNFDVNNFDNLFNSLGKLEGALGNLRGTFFELLVAELIRKNASATIELNKKIKSTKGDAEVDIWVFKEGVIAQIVECKGMAPGVNVDDNEVSLWLDRIQRVRKYFNEKGYNLKNIKPVFELWTSGVLSENSLEKIEKTKKANEKRIDIMIIGPTEIKNKLKQFSDRGLTTAFKHFLP